VFSELKKYSAYVGPLLVCVYTACAYWACGAGKKDEVSDSPYDLLCPGSESCASNTGALQVGAAKREITPTITETFTDCGLDGLCPGDDAYEAADSGEDNGEFDGWIASPDGNEGFDDVNGNSLFDAVWIAGFGNARAALGVHDPLWARALVVKQGDTTLALVSVDLVGYFYDEVVRIRESLAKEAGVDLLLVAASHTHQGPDTIGIWGYDEGRSGVDPLYMDFVRQEIKAAVEEAAGDLSEATLRVGNGKSGVHPTSEETTTTKGVNNLIRDGRDPAIMNDAIHVMQFKALSDDTTIATLVNWTNHPEVLCSHNRFISSDFVHYLRTGIEDGVHRGGVDVDGLGGMALFVNGAVGGMQTPLNIDIVDVDGTTIEHTCGTTNTTDDPIFLRAQALGELVALDALRVLADEGEDVSEPGLSFASKSFNVPVENSAYNAMFLVGVFYGRELHDFNRDLQITADNVPYLKTEVAVVNLGPMQSISVPGELLPELFLGGYDGSATGPAQQILESKKNREPEEPTACTQDSDCDDVAYHNGSLCKAYKCFCAESGICFSNAYNPPDLTSAPAGPYLRDKMTGQYKMVWGLTPDELGYLIPAYDYKLDERQPYIEEAPGDHYEETNSIGPTVVEKVEEHLTVLLGLFP